MQIVLIADPHLDHVDATKKMAFVDKVNTINLPKFILGDISTSRFLVDDVNLFTGDIHYVLGNHDFYGSDINSVTRSVLHDKRYMEAYPNVVYGDTTIIGVNGWAWCEGYDHYFPINDFALIENFKTSPHREKEAMYHSFNSSIVLRSKLGKVKTKNLIVITHVPLHKDTCFYDGVLQTKEYLPYFYNEMMGYELSQYCTKNPDVNVTTYSGHTHHNASLKIGNLSLNVLGAKYGEPEYVIVEI